MNVLSRKDDVVAPGQLRPDRKAHKVGEQRGSRAARKKLFKGSARHRPQKQAETLLRVKEAISEHQIHANASTGVSAQTGTVTFGNVEPLPIEGHDRPGIPKKSATIASSALMETGPQRPA